MLKKINESFDRMKSEKVVNKTVLESLSEIEEEKYITESSREELKPSMDGKEILTEEQKNWTDVFENFLDLIEFDLIKTKDEDGKDAYALVDRQGGNLGDIESERFKNAWEIFERLEAYILDYLVTPIEENLLEVGVECPWRFSDIIKLIRSEEFKNEHPDLWKGYNEDSSDIDMLDMIANHPEEIELDKALSPLYESLDDALLNKGKEILRDEIDWEQVDGSDIDDAIEQLRSLRTEEVITKDEYDFIISNWDRIIALIEDDNNREEPIDEALYQIQVDGEDMGTFDNEADAYRERDINVPNGKVVEIDGEFEPEKEVVYIKYWQDEDARDQGNSDVYADRFEHIEDAVNVAKRLIDRDGFASVEVLVSPSGEIESEDDYVVWGYDGVETWCESLKESVTSDLVDEISYQYGISKAEAKRRFANTLKDKKASESKLNALKGVRKTNAKAEIETESKSLKEDFETEIDWDGGIQEITRKDYYHFLDCMPPAEPKNPTDGYTGQFLMGEPYSSDEQGRLLFSKFGKKDGKYYFLGNDYAKRGSYLEGLKESLDKSRGQWNQAEIAKEFGKYDELKSLENDLLKINGVKNIDFSLGGLYDDLGFVIIVDFDIELEDFYNKRRELAKQVREVALKHNIVGSDPMELEDNYIYWAVHNKDNKAFESLKEEIDYTNEKYLLKPYWYFTTHGVSVGSIPKSVKNIWGSFEADNGTYFATDSVISTKDLQEFEIIEKQPNIDDIPEKVRINIQNWLENPLNESRPRTRKEIVVLQGNYGYGWDDLVEYELTGDVDKDMEIYKEIRQDKKDYAENEPQYSHRTIHRFEKIEQPLKEDNNINGAFYGRQDIRDIKVEPGYHEWVLSVDDKPYYSFGDLSEHIDNFDEGIDFANWLLDIFIDEEENNKNIDNSDFFTIDITSLSADETEALKNELIDAYRYYIGNTPKTLEYDRRAVERDYGLEDGELDGVSIKDAEIIVGVESGELDRYVNFEESLNKTNEKSDSISYSDYKQLKEDNGDLNTPNDREMRKLALANHLGVEPDYFEEESYDENVFSSKEYNEEYLVLTEDEAYDYAKRDIEDTFDDLGIESFTERFQTWIKENALDEEYFDGILDDEVEYFTSEEPDESMVEYVESYRSHPVDYYIDTFGEEGLTRLLKNKPNIIDKEAIAEECIRLDGVAHFIARYDGEEIVLGDGLYAYRTN